MLKNYQNKHPETKQARVFTNMEMSTIMYGDMCAHCQDQLLVEKLIADLAFFGALRAKTRPAAPHIWQLQWNAWWKYRQTEKSNQNFHINFRTVRLPITTHNYLELKWNLLLHEIVWLCNSSHKIRYVMGVVDHRVTRVLWQNSWQLAPNSCSATHS